MHFKSQINHWNLIPHYYQVSPNIIEVHSLLFRYSYITHLLILYTMLKLPTQFTQVHSFKWEFVFILLHLVVHSYGWMLIVLDQYKQVLGWLMNQQLTWIFAPNYNNMLIVRRLIVMEPQLHDLNLHQVP